MAGVVSKFGVTQIMMDNVPRWKAASPDELAAVLIKVGMRTGTVEQVSKQLIRERDAHPGCYFDGEKCIPYDGCKGCKQYILTADNPNDFIDCTCDSQ